MLLIWIALGLLLALALTSVGMFLFVFYRRAVEPYDNPETLDASRWRDYREPILAGLAWLKAQPTERMEIESFDGLRLSGLWVPNPAARGAIILFHGYRSSPVIDLTAGLQHYYAMGFSLLICDQRAHGKSGGRLITMGIKERYDAKAWAEALARKLGRETPLFLAGISMGAATVLMASNLPMEANVRGIVADCGFTSPGDIVRYLMRRHYHVPPRPAAGLLNLSCRLLGGFGLDPWSTVRAVAETTRPILFFHGEEDHFVPKEMTEAAYRACRSEKTLLEFPGAGHGLSYMADTPRYLAALRTFFDAALADAPHE